MAFAIEAEDLSSHKRTESGERRVNVKKSDGDGCVLCTRLREGLGSRRKTRLALCMSFRIRMSVRQRQGWCQRPVRATFLSPCPSSSRIIQD